MSIWLDHLGGELRMGEGGYRGRYVVGGQGEPLILLHGQGGHLENFSRNFAALATRFRVFALDCVWHGLGPQNLFDPELIPAFVYQLLAFMDAQGIEAAHIEGQSMGGWTALRLAHDHPARVRRLVLTTSQGFAVKLDSGRLHAAMPPPEMLASQLAFLQNPTRENIRQRMLGLFAQPENLPEEMIEVRHRLYNLPEVNTSLRAVVRSYMGGPDSPPRRHLVKPDELARIAAPTLVYWADANPGPSDLGRRLAEILPHAQYHCAANTGHWAQFENAEEHNREVLSFLCESQSGLP